MKRLTLLIFILLFYSNAFATSPIIIPDDSIGNWKVDTFVGNTMAGGPLGQGLAREVGGLNAITRITETPEGVYINPDKEEQENPHLMLIQDGVARIVMTRDGAMEGPIEMCAGGVAYWSDYDNTTYLTGPNCLRKIVEGVGGSRTVEVVAGICNQAGSTNGDAIGVAEFQNRKGVAIASDGTIYWLEQDGIRKIAGGQVTTLSLTNSERVDGNPFHLARLQK